ncbi:MAG: M56 family metallopeptidase [Bacteroidota bacterium]
MLTYLLHASVLLLVGYVFYQLLLRQETYFQTNRLLLIGLLLAALSLPSLKIPISWSFRPAIITTFSERINQKFSLTLPADPTTPVAQNGAPNSTTTALSRTTPWNWPGLVLLAYLLGVLVFLIALWVQFISLLLSRRGLQYMQDGPYRIYELEGDQPPFSFLHMVFINPSAYDYETFTQILTHEKIHIDQRHYLDILLAELLVIAFWFNPAAWGLRRAITRNLEYATDASMLAAGTEKKSYQLSLVKVSVSTRALHPATNYNQSFLSQRIDMMNSRRSSLAALWKYLSLLPLFLLLVLSLNATVEALDLDSPVAPLEQQSGTMVDELPNPQVNQVAIREEIARPTPAEVPIDGNRESNGSMGLMLLQDLNTLGYEGLHMTELNALIAHEIDADYIRQFQRLGFNHPSVSQLIETEVHEITPHYIESIRASGYPQFSLRDYIDLGIHAIPGEFLDGLNDVGIFDLNKGQIVEAWVLEVDQAYIHSIHSEGIDPTSYFNYKEAKVHGVTPYFISEARASGLRSNNLRDYTQLKLQTGSLLRSSTNLLSSREHPSGYYREIQALELPERGTSVSSYSWSAQPIIYLDELAALKYSPTSGQSPPKGPPN